MLTKAEIHRLFTYHEGVLYWRTRLSNRTLLDSPAGAITHDGYVRVGIGGRSYPAHRLVWMYHYGECPSYLDHKDGNRQNNRIENLRPATQTQNNANAPYNKNNRLGVRGVIFSTRRNKYRARIGVDRHKILLGWFMTLEEAKSCYDTTAREWFGEFYRS